MTRVPGEKREEREEKKSKIKAKTGRESDNFTASLHCLFNCAINEHN